MTKRTQLMEYITQDVIAYLMEDQSLDMAEAMRRFYTSETYEKLLDEETGLYLESSAYIYDLFKNEFQNGQIFQNEI
jgi:geranylgeranyl pyrophosphate synthase